MAAHDRAAEHLARRLEQNGLEVRDQVFEIESVLELYDPPVLRVEAVKDPFLPRRDFAEHPRSADAPDDAAGIARRWRPGGRVGEIAILESVPQGSDLPQLVEQMHLVGVRGVLVPQFAGRDGFLTKRLMGAAPVTLPMLAVRSERLGELEEARVTVRVPLRRVAAPGRNLIGRLPGGTGDPVLLTAHYDGVGDDPGIRLPGAADNASGIAVMLEVARVLAIIPLRRPVWIVLVDAEEVNALGSLAHADALRAAGTRVSVLNLDMAGRRNLVVAVESGPGAERLLGALDRAGEDSEVSLEIAPVASDNRRYAAAGFPAVGLGFGAAAYHSPADTAELVEPAALEAAGRLILAALGHLETW